MSPAKPKSRRGDTRAGTATPQPKRARRTDSNRPSDELSQFTLKMRLSLHRELARKAFNSNMTMRGYIMQALKAQGLKVTQADLVDGRRT